MTTQVTRHILLAEDNAADELLVREALKEHQVACALHVVKDGAQAISFIQNLDKNAHAERPLDLLLLDMHLPKQDGDVILRALRSTTHYSHKPVIVMSSNDPGLGSEGDPNALYFFQKPSSLDEFMRLGSLVKGILDHPNPVARGIA